MLTTTEVFIWASLLVRDCALVGYLIADVTKFTTTLDTTNGGTICPVRS